MRILAFDQASRTSGWSFYEDQKLIDHGTFTFSEPYLGKRLYQIRQQVKKLILYFKPDKIAFEDIQLQENAINNVDTFKILAEVFGILEELFTEMNIPYEAILSGTWRKGLGIIGVKRDIRKANTQRWVFDNYNLRATEDEADAICIGAYASGIRSKKQKPIKEESFDWS